MTLERGKREENVEDGSLRTIECLRGRLVAERQASRAAEENAQLIANKLKELEEKLKEETRLRDKATKKLKFLERKLKSKKSLSQLKESEESSVSESSTLSCKSSMTTTVTSRTNPEQDQEQNHVPSVVSKCDVSKVTEPKTSYDISCSSSEKCGSDLAGYEQKHSAIVPEMEKEEEEEDEGSSVDNSLALVPVTVPEEYDESQTKELKIMSRSVGEVLETLRRAREGIQRNMRQNDMMKLRPSHAQIC